MAKKLTNQPSAAPLRKITVISTVGSVASIVFAAAPQIMAAFPATAPWMQAAMVIMPAVLGPLGYQVKEWAQPTAHVPVLDD